MPFSYFLELLFQKSCRGQTGDPGWLEDIQTAAPALHRSSVFQVPGYKIQTAAPVLRDRFLQKP